MCGTLVLKKDKDFTRKPACCSVECSVKANQMHLPMKKCEICGELFKASSGVATICNKEHHKPCSICGKDMIVTKRMWHDKIDTCSKECAKEKLRRFYQDKYGVDHPMQNSEVQAHFRDAMKNKYGVEHALQKDEFLQSAFETNLRKFGTKYACLRDECQLKSPFSPISKNNERLGNMLTNLGIKVEYELPLDSRKFDLFLPDQQTTIEIDPTYTHNSYDNHWHEPASPSYHKMKTDISLAAGYRCVHVFDWDQTEKIIDIFRPKKSIGARMCTIEKIDKDECNDFLNKYHLQGTVRGQSYSIGLKYNDEILEVRTFGKSRFDKKFDVELLRLCTRSGFVVSGGATKLFNYALKENPQWKSVVSYCDLAKFTGDIYYRLGMKHLRTTPPQIIWSKGTDKINSTLLRQRGFDQLFKTNYGKGTSNEQLMLEHGWLPVYDCGQNVFGVILKEDTLNE